MNIRFFIENNTWHVLKFVGTPFLAQMTACHIQIFVFGMIPCPRKSVVTKDLNFNFVNFTKSYTTTAKFFELLKVSRFDAL